jgi:hypothetical protein
MSFVLSLVRLRRASCAAAIAVLAAACGPGHNGDAGADGHFVPLDTGSADAGICGDQWLRAPGGNNGNVVRLAYLTPTDRPERPEVTARLEAAVRHLQIWWYAATHNTVTFTIPSPVVRVAGLAHAASYYAAHPHGTDQNGWFWGNVLDDALPALGAMFGDRSSIWLVYIDADPACGQFTGAVDSVGIMPANDIRGLMGEPPRPCGAGDMPGTGHVCRWIGGMGWVFATAVGLGAPPGCADMNASTPCESDSITWTGFYQYPDAKILPNDITYCQHNQFFSSFPVSTCLPDCNAL